MSKATARFVVDSTADLLPEYRDQHNISVVPLRVIFGEEEFRDGFDISPREFFTRVERGETEPPRTSQPTPAEFEKAFREAGKSGLPIICTTISAEMSGTWNSATAARDALPDLDIRLIDSRTVSAGHTLIVQTAVNVAEAGGPPDTVVAAIEEIKASQRLVFTVESLEHLRRGGRIGGARALVGSVLNIKPVLQVRDGHVDTLDKVRTYSRAIERLVEELAADTERWAEKARAAICHAARPEQAQTLAETCAPHVQGEVDIVEIGPVIGCHGGPGSIGISYHRPLKPFG